MRFAFLLLAVEGIITGYMMLQLMEIISRGPDGYTKIKMYKLVTSIPISFIINFLVSSVMTWFTGAGLTAGFANLGSSVVIGVVLPPILRWKYPLEAVVERVKENREIKRKVREEHKLNKKQRKAA